MTTTNISSTNIDISNAKRNYKTHLPDLFSYYDFSDKSNIGYDASGNNRTGTSLNSNWLSEYNGRQNVLFFNQTAGLTIANGQHIGLQPYLNTFEQKQNAF